MTVTDLHSATRSAARTGTRTVDAAASRLELTMRIGGLLGVRGRFTRLTGHVGVDPDPRACTGAVTVDLASLTAGSPRRDAVLAAAGIVDPAAGPVVTYRSTAVTRDAGGWRIDGVLATERAARSVRLDVDRLPDPGRPVRHLVHARGVLSRADVVALVAHPGAAPLLGREARLDLALAVPAAPDA